MVPRYGGRVGLQSIPRCSGILQSGLGELGEPSDHPAAGEMERLSLAVSSDVKRYALLAHRSQLGELVLDDPTGFVLGPETITRLTGPEEVYWRQCNVR